MTIAKPTTWPSSTASHACPSRIACAQPAVMGAGALLIRQTYFW
jgi:hypothetical protein